MTQYSNRLDFEYQITSITTVVAMSKEEVIYVIFLNFGDDKLRCKVGRTNNLLSRLQTIKTAFPGEHMILGTETPALGTAKEVESYVLAKLERFRCREGGGKELFDFTVMGSKEKVVEFVKRIVKETEGMFEACAKWKQDEKEAEEAGWDTPRTIPARPGIKNKVARLRELQAEAKVLELQCDAIKDSLRSEFATSRASEIVLTPGDTIRYTLSESERLDTKRLEKEYPLIAKECSRATKTRRLTIGT